MRETASHTYMLAMVRPCSCPSNRSEPKAGGCTAIAAAAAAAAVPSPLEVGAAESCWSIWWTDGARGERARGERARGSESRLGAEQASEHRGRGSVWSSSPAAAPPPLARIISASRSVISASEIAPLTRATCRGAALLTTHYLPLATHHSLLATHYGHA